MTKVALLEAFQRDKRKPLSDDIDAALGGNCVVAGPTRAFARVCRLEPRTGASRWANETVAD